MGVNLRSPIKSGTTGCFGSRSRRGGRDDRLIWFEVLDQVRDDKIKMPSGAIPVAAVTKFAGAVEDFKLRFPRSYANTRE